MPKSLADLMRDAKALVSAGRLDEATAAIRQTLTGTGETPTAGGLAPRRIATAEADRAPSPGESGAALAERLKALLPAVAGVRPRFPPPGSRPSQTPAPDVAEGTRFETRVHEGPHGSRRYRLFVPARPADGPRPLLVMLHGCTQDPDDFAAGTRMNALAEEAGLLVAYPEQPSSANAQKCWNWFEPAHQRPGAGEPAILAGIVEDVAAAFDVDRRRVFAAGLSAGGAMAAILGATYPALFSAVGVHSGLPHGAAADVMSALSVMRSGRPAGRGAAIGTRLIVFHGERDRTVHPANGEALAGLSASDPTVCVERGTAGGRTYARAIGDAASGRPAVESWTIDGLGHAWSGGDKAGSYADPDGPDASREMLRFFLSPG